MSFFVRHIRASASTAEETGVTVGENSAIRCHEPVALAVWRNSHANNWLNEMDVSRRAVESGVTEAEDATIGCHQPVALPIWSRCHAHDGLVEGSPSHG